MKTLAVTVLTLLAMTLGVDVEPNESRQEHAPITVFDLFELSPEQFATMMNGGGE